MKTNPETRQAKHEWLEIEPRDGLAAGITVVSATAWLMAGIVGLINLLGIVVGFTMSTEPAWFSEEAERILLVAAIVIAVLIFGGTIGFMAWLGGGRWRTWAMVLLVALLITQVTLISGAQLANGLAVWLAATPHRVEAKFYDARPVVSKWRTVCQQKITVQPALPRFEGRVPSFCAPGAVVESGLKHDDQVVLVGRASWLGFVVERVERAP